MFFAYVCHKISTICTMVAVAKSRSSAPLLVATDLSGFKPLQNYRVKQVGGRRKFWQFDTVA